MGKPRKYLDIIEELDSNFCIDGDTEGTVSQLTHLREEYPKFDDFYLELTTRRDYEEEWPYVILTGHRKETDEEWEERMKERKQRREEIKAFEKAKKQRREEIKAFEKAKEYQNFLRLKKKYE